ncbi:hypothetical protein H4S07_004314, partial [Coemansia furcata]
MKTVFDHKHTLVDFNIGNLVLARITPVPPKGQLQFSSPFVISKILQGGSIEL